MPAVVLVLAALASVLALSGLAKTPRRARRDTRDAMMALRVPARVPRRLTGIVLPWAELALAASLLVLPAPWLVLPAVATTALMAVYTALIARALRFPDPVTCACFGRLLGSRVDGLSLARNLVLVALAATATILAATGHDFPSAASTDAISTWLTVAAAVAVGLLVALLAWGAGDRSTPFDYVRAPIPYGVLHDADGGSRTLRELASERAQLLVFLTPDCAPCERTAARLEEWSRSLAPTVSVMTVRPSDEPDGNVRRVLGIAGTPGAVLLGADGLLAGGPVAGEQRVAELVEDILAELAAVGP